MKNTLNISHLTTKVVLLIAIGMGGFVLPANAQSVPSCAFSPQSGRTIISFPGQRLYADRGQSDSIGKSVSTSLEAGDYRVSVMSFDKHTTKPSTQKKEQWHMILERSGSTTITTNTSPDLPENQDTATYTVHNRLSIPQKINRVTPIHSFYPSSSAESVYPICAAFDKLPTISSAPTPTPTTIPTQTPTPTPNNDKGDDDNDDDDDDDDESVGLSVIKTDHRNITRPGHTLTYTITVKNTGEKTLPEIEVTDVVPSALTITSVSNSGGVSGNKITWREFALSEGESQTFRVNTRVKTNVASGHVLANTVKARDNDESISVSDTDTTVVERKGQVAGTTVEKPSIAPVVKAAATTITPASPVPVPITATTGPVQGTLALLSIIAGSAGLFTVRKI